MKILRLVLTPAMFASSAPAVAVAQQGPDIHDTRLLSQPAVSETHIAFAYAGDLWVAGVDGSGVRRLTSHIGTESRPRFSPDGEWIAFSGEYDGNVDVFVVRAEGGVPQRLTWHPGPDRVQEFTVDGSAVLFTSPRAVHTSRHVQLFTVPVGGGMPEQLPIPYAFKATYSPDGSRIAYVPLGERFNQWKHYRGGTVSRIWLYDAGDHSVEEIPQPAGRSNDTDPMWMGGTVFFRSDRNGEFNLFSYDLSSERIEQLTWHEDFPIVNASAGAGRIVYEQAGYLHVFDPRVGETSRLQVGVAADLNETRPRYVEGDRYIRRSTVSPHGARVAFEFRGEIVTVPAKKGDPRNLTESPGAHERSPAWSPDGRWIAYFSDASGEYELHLVPQDGRGEVRRFPLDGAGFYQNPKWSPDGTMISYTDNSWSLYWLDVATGRSTKVSSEPYYGPVNTLHHTWSPDSRWLAYTRNSATYFQTVYLYSIDEQTSRAVTDGLSDVGEPVFDASGKYLYFSASTDAGPVRQWFAQSNADDRLTNTVYLAVLQRGVPSPLARESDEETAAHEGNDTGQADGDVRVTVDFDGIDQRIVVLPLEPAHYSNLLAGKAGQLYYLKREAFRLFESGGGPAALNRFDLARRQEETLLSDVDGFRLTPDGTKALLVSDDAWFLADATGKIDKSRSRLATEAIQVRIEPLVEWRQIFHEAWRINRDYFYDPNMHGADWPAMRDKYGAFLPHVVTRSDLNRVMQWMFSELSVGHHRVGGDGSPSRGWR